MLFPVSMAYADEDVYGKQVWSYYMGSAKFNVNMVPEWQVQIYRDLGINQDTMLLMRTVNQLECWDPDWFCMWLNAADAGPFQINFIHGMIYRIPEKDGYHPNDDYGKSRYLVKAGRKARSKAMSDWDWKETVRIRNELFAFQAKWTWERMKRLANQYQRKTDYSNRNRTEQVWLQALWHNGNTKMKNGRQFRFFYADKAVKHYTLLKSAYWTERFVLASDSRPPTPKDQVKETYPKVNPTVEEVPVSFPDLEAHSPVTESFGGGVSFSFPITQ